MRVCGKRTGGIHRGEDTGDQGTRVLALAIEDWALLGLLAVVVAAGWLILGERE